MKIRKRNKSKIRRKIATTSFGMPLGSRHPLTLLPQPEDEQLFV